jgi:hypothetical protein
MHDEQTVRRGGGLDLRPGGDQKGPCRGRFASIRKRATYATLTTS